MMSLSPGKRVETYTAEALKNLNHKNTAKQYVLIPYGLKLKNSVSLKVLGLLIATVLPSELLIQTALN